MLLDFFTAIAATHPTNSCGASEGEGSFSHLTSMRLSLVHVSLFAEVGLRVGVESKDGNGEEVREEEEAGALDAKEDDNGVEAGRGGAVDEANDEDDEDVDEANDKDDDDEDEDKDDEDEDEDEEDEDEEEDEDSTLRGDEDCAGEEEATLEGAVVAADCLCLLTASVVYKMKSFVLTDSPFHVIAPHSVYCPH